MASRRQTTLMQSVGTTGGLPNLMRCDTSPIPSATSEHQVLVRVLAVALNPNDAKMLANFPIADAGAGCDFCGIVASNAPGAAHVVGTRVCGTVCPYGGAPAGGTPVVWGPLQSGWVQLWAAWAGPQWASHYVSAPDALDLQGVSSSPTIAAEPVLVYGGGP
ncbi:GroES-like protein [Xylariaceae sp. FL0255]|nr:GroES-like protein [Xylariaceae sp. FL0255]